MAAKHICWNRSVPNVAGVCYDHPTKCQLGAPCRLWILCDLICLTIQHSKHHGIKNKRQSKCVSGNPGTLKQEEIHPANQTTLLLRSILWWARTHGLFTASESQHVINTMYQMTHELPLSYPLKARRQTDSLQHSQWRSSCSTSLVYDFKTSLQPSIDEEKIVRLSSGGVEFPQPTCTEYQSMGGSSQITLTALPLITITERRTGSTLWKRVAVSLQHTHYIILQSDAPTFNIIS